MRLWSLHPAYLDAKGLVALWREALLAKKVLEGGTRGYTHHPQLERFRAAVDPSLAIGLFLAGVYRESERRGYRFDAGKISPFLPPQVAGRSGSFTPLPVTSGQLSYERELLALKLGIRSPGDAARLAARAPVEPNPVFRVVPGGIEPWERSRPDVLARLRSALFLRDEE